MTACYTTTSTTQTCVVCPEIPAVAAVPAQTIYSPRIGWDASAFSAKQLSGDVFTEFTLPPCVGTVVGLANERKSSDPRDVQHGFYAYQHSGRERWSVVEHGVEKTVPIVRAPDTDTFRIERRGSTVRYFHNGKQVYASTLPSLGTLAVVACLFASGDGVN